MKTSNILAAALVICSAALSAQSENKNSTGTKEVKVHIKKVENINGVEKITDTTYTTTDITSIPGSSSKIKITNDGGKEQVVIVETEGDEKAFNVTTLKPGDGIDADIEKAMREAGIQIDMQGKTPMVLINDDSKNSVNSYEKKVMKVVVIRADLKDATEAERKQAGISEPKSKLAIDDMNCTPNPSSGKFNLKFSSPDKGNADITVRDINGKVVYSESVKDFTGSYSKEINLDQNVKGIYFVTITQGTKATTKKLVVE